MDASALINFAQKKLYLETGDEELIKLGKIFRIVLFSGYFFFIGGIVSVWFVSLIDS